MGWPAGNFTRALFSLFQMSTGDSWASGITRGLMDMEESQSTAGLIALFFVSYMLIVGVGARRSSLFAVCPVSAPCLLASPHLPSAVELCLSVAVGPVV